MKKVLTLIAMLLTLGAFSQHRGPRGKMQQPRLELTPQQQATLQSKRMALVLELDTPQQEAVQRLLKSRFEARAELRDSRERTGPDASGTPEARYNRMEARLDRELAFRQELKGILTEAQYAQWKTHQALKQEHRRARKDRRGMRHGRRH